MGLVLLNWRGKAELTACTGIDTIQSSPNFLSVLGARSWVG